MLFIDFQNAYETIGREKLVEAMRELQIPQHLINLVMFTMTDVSYFVKIDNKLSKNFGIGRGVRQGDALTYKHS